MPFINFKANVFNSLFSNRPYRKFKEYRKYVEPIESLPDTSLEVFTFNGGSIGKIYTNVEKPILQKIKFTIDDFGSRDFEIHLSELPDFPLINFSQIIFSIDKEKVFGGYIYDLPEVGNTKEKAYIIKGFGFKKRLEEVTIQTKENYNIQSISFNGSTNVCSYYTTQNLDLSKVEMGCKIFVSNSENKINDGLYTIIGLSSNRIDIYTPFAVNQSIIIGEIKVLPLTWSESSKLVSEVLTHIIANFGLGSFGLPLKYNPLLIEETIGITIGGVIDFNKLTLLKTVQALQNILGNEYKIFIDANGFWNLKKLNSEIKGVFNIGFNVNDFELKLDYDKIRNVITVLRAGTKTESGNSVIGAIGNPQEDVATSISKYGRKEEKIELPSYFSDEACQLIANQTLSVKKEPRFQSKIKKAFLKNYEFGNYKIITTRDNQKEIINECDSLTDWNFNSIPTFLDANILMTGAKSIRIEIDTINNSQYFDLDLINFNLSQKQKINIWIRSNKLGNLLEIGFIGNNDSKIFNISFDSINQFIFFSFEIKDMISTFLNKIRFYVKNISELTYINLDEISLSYFGEKHIINPLKLATYNISNSEKFVDLDLGLETDKLEDFLNGIKASKENQSLYLNK